MCKSLTIWHFQTRTWSDVFLIFSCFVKMHKFTLHNISHWLYLCLLSSLPLNQGLLLVLGWLKKKIFLKCFSCLKLHNRLTNECSDIFLCTHTPSKEDIKIQQRLPNSDQIAPCNQRSSPNKRPPLSQSSDINPGWNSATKFRKFEILLSCYENCENNENYKILPAHRRKVIEKCKWGNGRPSTKQRKLQNQRKFQNDENYKISWGHRQINNGKWRSQKLRKNKCGYTCRFTNGQRAVSHGEVAFCVWPIWPMMNLPRGIFHGYVRRTTEHKNVD